MSDTTTYRAISVKLAAFLCREKWSDELPEKTRKEMQRLVKEWQDVDRDHKPSDTTNERPDKPGLWFRYGEPYSVTYVEPDVCCYAIQSNGIPTYLRCAAMEGGWSKAVPASELATLQADCERWSREYARQADELVALKAQRDTFKFQRDVFEASVREMNNYCEELKEAYCQQAHAELVSQVATLQSAIASGCERVAELEARLAEVVAEAMERLKQRAEAAEAERDKFKRIDECNQGTIDIAIKRAEAAEGRVKKIQTAWNRVAGFAVSESCGPENRFRITIDYPTLEKLQDAYRAMHDITTAIATTPPAAGAQSS